MLHLENDLRRLAIEDYQDARSRVASLPSVSAGQVDLVQFGAVRHPGISDLDILLHGAGKALVEVQRDIEALIQADADFRYILWHPPLYVPHGLSECAVALHTLRGASTSTGLDESAPFVTAHASDNALKSREVVPWAWFLFLLPIAERLLTRQRVSLRMTLLLHKNLVESVNMVRGRTDWTPVEETREAAQRGKTEDVLNRLKIALSQARDEWNACVGEALDLRPTHKAVMAGGRVFSSEASLLRWIPKTRIFATLRPMELAFLERLVTSAIESCETTDERFAYYRAFHNRSRRVLASLNLHNGFVAPFGLKF